MGWGGGGGGGEGGGNLGLVPQYYFVCMREPAFDPRIAMVGMGWGWWDGLGVGHKCWFRGGGGEKNLAWPLTLGPGRWSCSTVVLVHIIFMRVP